MDEVVGGVEILGFIGDRCPFPGRESENENGDEGESALKPTACLNRPDTAVIQWVKAPPVPAPSAALGQHRGRRLGGVPGIGALDAVPQVRFRRPTEFH